MKTLQPQITQMALVCIKDFQQIVEQFSFEQALKLGSKVELNQCFSEIILVSVSDVWAVLKIPKENPPNKAMIMLHSMKTSDCFLILLTQYANRSLSYSWDSHFMCFSFQLFHVSLATRLHNAPKLINTPPKKQCGTDSECNFSTFPF